MSRAVFLLPPEQLDRAHAAYRATVAAKRVRLFTGLGVLLVLIVLAGMAGEVNFEKFVSNIHRFPNYIWSITPALSIENFGADVGNWLWNIKEWSKLLVDTLL